MNKRLNLVITALMLFGILLTACSSTTELPQETIVPDATEAAVEPANESEITPTPTTVSVGGNCTGTPVRWYIGLGAGGNPEEIEKETAFLEKFNDKYGHDVGDQVLKMVGAKLAKVNGHGKPFRYGGEEFAVLFPGKQMDEALSLIHI